jgi:hypothetical protein
MAYFTKLDENNYVTEIISVNNLVITENGVENENLGKLFLNQTYNNQSNYKKTSYNTRGGIHYQSDGTPSPEQNKSFRKNYAGIGFYYDEVKDSFIPPKPFNSWILNEETCLWNPPISFPTMENIPFPYKKYNHYIWNENIINWELQKPFESWILHQDNYYISPIPHPSDNQNCFWNEEENNWIINI